MRRFVTQSQARQLLHNKFVVVLGGSVQRSIYKDLVLLLQKDQYLTASQLKSKGEFSFERDCLVEGGRFGPMTNGTEYREVRQYRSSHHLLRFYFITRIYSSYMESILEDFRHGLKPDVIIVNSCIWDISRYGPECLPEYKENLHKFFGRIKATLCHDCLILWLLAMPLGKKIKGGFLVPEIHHLGPALRYDVIEANFYSGRLADGYGLDVVDLHFQFRFSLHHRMPDGIHWDAVAHRRITSLLLQHAAHAWGVELHASPSPPGQVFQNMFDQGNVRHHSNRPVWSPPRPLLNSGAFQRRSLVRDQENHISSAWFQHAAPPNSARRVRHPEAVQLRRQQDCSRGVEFNQHYHNRVTYRRSTHPEEPHPPPARGFPAAGNRTHSGQYYNPLSRSSVWTWQRDDIRASTSRLHLNTDTEDMWQRSVWRGWTRCRSSHYSGQGFRGALHPENRPEDHCAPRRRRNIRVHPYPQRLSQVTPRHPAYGW